MTQFPFLEYIVRSLEELKPGEDPHEHTAKKVFGDASPENRARAKALNYMACWSPPLRRGIANDHG